MSLVLVGQTQVADALSVGAAKHLQQLVVLPADGLLQSPGGRHQLMCLEGGGLVVRLDVDLAVGGQAHQTRLHSLVLHASADVALHVVRFGRTVVRWRRGLVETGGSKFLHHVGQHGVSGEQRPRTKVLPALGTGEDPQEVVLVPVVLDTVGAIAVSARDRYRVFQDLQTYRAVELVLIQDYSGLSHRHIRRKMYSED